MCGDRDGDGGEPGNFDYSMQGPGPGSRRTQSLKNSQKVQNGKNSKKVVEESTVSLQDLPVHHIHCMGEPTW